jgi:MFS superfamily sulfate permease-like transporter
VITGELKSKVDRVWDAFWSGGISNPLEVIEQITYLLFIRRLDDLTILAEKKAQRTGKAEKVIFGPDQQDLRWSVFKNQEPAQMARTVGDEVFPFLRSLGGDGSTYSEHMKDARFTIPTPALLSRVVDMLDEIPMADRDTTGDLYEYLLAKIASAGVNGQFRTPRHIIKLMVDMTAPQPTDEIADPACGTAGFLVAAAIVGGVVAGVLGGSPLQVSGPAAGLTVIVAGLVAEFGWAVTCAITVCAGFLQILFGLTKVGRAALAISPMVVHAMLAGIGITIALQQMHVLLGGESYSSAWYNLIRLPSHIGANLPGTAIGLLVIAILIAWRRVPVRARKIPGPLVAILVATIVASIFNLGIPRVELDGSLLDALQLPSLPDGLWGGFAVGVLTVALIASVESLLTAVAVDRMQTRVRSNLDRELIGQGAANMLSGAIGGLPITGVIVRSSANVAAGARTRASSVLHGIWVLVFALPFAGLVEQIPTAALAGLLIVIGIQLVKLTHVETARRTGDLAVYLITVAGVVFLNLLEGVLLGLALSVVMTACRVARADISVEAVTDDHWRVTIHGPRTFLCLPRLHTALNAVPPGSHVALVMSAGYTDHAVLDFLDEWRRQHEACGGLVSTTPDKLPVPNLTAV